MIQGQPEMIQVIYSLTKAGAPRDLMVFVSVPACLNLLTRVCMHGHDTNTVFMPCLKLHLAGDLCGMKKSSCNIRVLLFPRIVKMAADVQKRKSAPSKGVSISIINDYPRSPSQSSPRQRRDTGTDTRSTKQEITEQI